MALRFWRAEESVTARGSLVDVHVVELIQLIGQARKTGALAMSSGDRESVLYFRKGELVDVRTGPDKGIEALSQIIDWRDGAFEFRGGAVTSEVTIYMDAHDALTAAARLRDENKQRAQEEALRKQEEEQGLAAEPMSLLEPAARNETLTAGWQFSAEEWRQQEMEVVRRDAPGYEPAPVAAVPQTELHPEQRAHIVGAAEEPVPEPLDSVTCEQIGQWIARSPFLLHVSLLDGDGRVIGEAHAPGTSPNGTSKLSQHMLAFAREYPRAEMRRVVIEDEAGTVVLANLPQERLLIAVADSSVSLGNVCVTLSKMTVSLGA